METWSENKTPLQYMEQEGLKSVFWKRVLNMFLNNFLVDIYSIGELRDPEPGQVE